jgi:ribosomal protein S18 acetylase RimI-like enzyme
LGSPGAGPDGRIRNVYVAPQFRRRGVGRALTLAAIAAAEEMGVSRLVLGASDDGRSLYEALGFVAKDDEMVYERPLGARG